MSEEHKAKINSNLFNEYILELQDKYKELHVMQAPGPIEIVDIQAGKKKEEE